MMFYKFTKIDKAEVLGLFVDFVWRFFRGSGRR